MFVTPGWQFAFWSMSMLGKTTKMTEVFMPNLTQKKIFSCVCYQFLSSLEKNKQHTKVPFYNLIFFLSFFSPLKLSGKPFLSVINWINRLTMSPCWFWHVSLYWVKNNWSHWYIVLLYVFLRMWIHSMFTLHLYIFVYSVLPIY